MNELKQGAYWTNHANQVVWGWVERYHVGIIGWGKHMRVRVDDRNESCEFVPERTCVDLAMADTKFRCSLCFYECKCAKCSSFDFSGLPWLAYCPNCGAKVVES